MGEAQQRVRRPHADAERQLVVHGCQRARQAAGVPALRRWRRHVPAICNEVVERGYLGFELAGADGVQVNDGVIRQLKPDVGMMIQMMAALGLPPIESLSPRGRPGVHGRRRRDEPARARGRRGRRRRARRCGRRPAVPLVPPGHARARIPIVAYFHGGGWVLGNLDSDDAMCRDLCVKSDAIIVSVNYRHAPEDRFPAAADDGFAAVQWIAGNAERARRRARPPRGVRLERRRQRRRRGRPVGPRCRWAGAQRQVLLNAGDRQRPDDRFVRAQR